MRILLYTIALVALFSCGASPENGKPTLVVTIEPYRFIAEAVAGDAWHVVSIVPQGASPETFDPAPGQMMKLGNCRVWLLAGGLGFENQWSTKITEIYPSLNMVDTSVGIERIDGDPHLWTSPDNMAVIADNICATLCALDSTNRDGYTARLGTTKAMLVSTDSLIRSTLATGADSGFLIFHPSLTYFARLYGLNQMVVEEHGKEPSARHIKNLVDEARNGGVDKVFVQAEFDKNHAATIARELSAEIITIDPLSYDWRGEMLHIAHTLADGKE